MAIYNEILSARFASAIKKIFSMKGPNPTKQLAGELMPVLPLFFGAEARFLELWNRFGILKAFPASAANFNQFRLRNPVGSGLVVVIEKISVVTNATADLFDLSVGPTSVDLANSLQASVMRFDARGQQSPVAVPTWQQTAAANTLGSTIAKAGALANTTVDFLVTDIQELPLLPGDAYHVNAETVNLAQNIAIWWRERVMEESERQ